MNRIRVREQLWYQLWHINSHRFMGRFLNALGENYGRFSSGVRFHLKDLAADQVVGQVQESLK